MRDRAFAKSVAARAKQRVAREFGERTNMTALRNIFFPVCDIIPEGEEEGEDEDDDEKKEGEEKGCVHDTNALDLVDVEEVQTRDASDTDADKEVQTRDASDTDTNEKVQTRDASDTDKDVQTRDVQG
jgi:hypothetical protein